MVHREIIDRYSLRKDEETEIEVQGNYPYSTISVKSLTHILNRRISEGSLPENTRGYHENRVKDEIIYTPPLPEAA
jgi:hypothetical protein